MHFSCLLICAVFCGNLAARAEVTVQSGPARVHLVELYTSEGCSSCPPAERWLSALWQNPRLWQNVVPLAFHVDYWDGLGWKDSLAAPAFSARQRRYAAGWGSGTVYTPGFVLDGREWRDPDPKQLAASDSPAGLLHATYRENGEVAVTFQPAGKSASGWEAHAALLGSGLSADVKAGENRGRKLAHDFAVLALESATMPEGGTPLHAMLKLPSGPNRSHAALAVWITATGGMESVQAAGGPLEAAR